MRADILPRLIPEAAAAAYVGIELSTFRHWVACSRLPKPVLDTGLFDLHAIDAALDRISGIKSPAGALDAWLLENEHAG